SNVRDTNPTYSQSCCSRADRKRQGATKQRRWDAEGRVREPGSECDRASRRRGLKQTPIRTLSDVLREAKQRPVDFAAQTEKTQYAARFANAMAQLIANGLRTQEVFRGVLPSASGEGSESEMRSTRGTKRLDVNFSTPRQGLGLLV